MTSDGFERLDREDAERIADALAVSARGAGETPTVPLADITDSDLRRLATLAAQRKDVDRETVLEEIGEIAAQNISRETRDMASTAAREAATAIDYDEVVKRAVEGAMAGTRDDVDHESTAIYKTQLQKGGRIAVPEAEIEALGLEPGDTLQVELFKVDS